MSRWIDANATQRLQQYTLPAARKEVAEAPAFIAELKAAIAKAWAGRADYAAADYGRRRANRRVRELVRELRSYQSQVEWSRNLIAQHGRR